MKLSLVITICLVLFCFLLCESYVEAATVKGRVLNSRSSGPIANANVVIVGTALGTTTNVEGSFNIENVPLGRYVLSASLVGAKQKEMNIVVDSANQTVEVTMLLKVANQPYVPGCDSNFYKYQSDLAGYIAKNPNALSFEISGFQVRDSSSYGSVILTVTNNTPYGVYLLKDYENGMQMYISKLLDASSNPVQSTVTIRYDNLGSTFLHDLSDVIRVPRLERVIVDTVKLWRYDVTHLPAGKYKLQLVYVFPKSRASSDDRQYVLLSPIANEKAVGELYCMTLQGRFESNWLPIEIQ